MAERVLGEDADYIRILHSYNTETDPSTYVEYTALKCKHCGLGGRFGGPLIHKPGCAAPWPRYMGYGQPSEE